MNFWVLQQRFFQRLSALKANFYTVPSREWVRARVALNHSRHDGTPRPLPREVVSSPGGLTHVFAIAVERWVNRKTGRRADRQTDMQTDGHTAQDWVVATRTTRQRSIYNSPKYVIASQCIYSRKGLCNWHFIYRDTVAILDYHGMFPWSLCDVRRIILWRCSTFSVILYSKIKILSTLMIILNPYSLRDESNTLFPGSGKL